MKARIIDNKAVIFQKTSQFHWVGKSLPIVPKPPICFAPSLLNIKLSDLTYVPRVLVPVTIPAGIASKKP